MNVFRSERARKRIAERNLKFEALANAVTRSVNSSLETPSQNQSKARALLCSLVLLGHGHLEENTSYCLDGGVSGYLVRGR